MDRFFGNLSVFVVLILTLSVVGCVIFHDDCDAASCPDCGGSGKVTCPVCGGDGYTSGYESGTNYEDGCTNCGGSGTLDNWTDTIVYGSGKVTCSTCGGSGTHTHSWKSNGGYWSGCDYYVKKVCSGCGETDSYYSYTSHSWGSWVTTKSPTCTTSGTQKRTCSDCGDYETRTVSATGHSWTVSGYSWSSDHSKCTVSYKCSNNSSHTGSETFNSKSSVDGNTITYSISGTSSQYGVKYSASVAVHTCRLNFDANSGSGAPTGLSFTGTSTSNHSFSIPTTEPVRTGYTFLGWAMSSVATAASYQPGGTVSVGYNSTVTLYAVWEKDEPSISWTTYPDQDCIKMPVITYRDDGTFTISEAS